MGDTYISICCIFSFGVFVEICLERTLQATGNMIWPMIFQLIGAVTNIIMDPILIFGWFGLPAMGVAGAAIATVMGQILAMVVAALVVTFGKHDVHVSFRHFPPELAHHQGTSTWWASPPIVMQSIGTGDDHGSQRHSLRVLHRGLHGVRHLLQAPVLRCSCRSSA